MLLEDFLEPMGLSQRDLADGIHVPYQRVNELVYRRRGVTPSTALRLAKFLGTSAGYWMNLQLRWDLYHAQQQEQTELKSIKKTRRGGLSAVHLDDATPDGSMACYYAYEVCLVWYVDFLGKSKWFFTPLLALHPSPQAFNSNVAFPSLRRISFGHTHLILRVGADPGARTLGSRLT